MNNGTIKEGMIILRTVRDNVRKSKQLSMKVKYQIELEYIQLVKQYTDYLLTISKQCST